MVRRKLVPRAERIVINQEFRTLDALLAQYGSDISRTGVFVRAAEPLPVGTRVSLQLTVIDRDLEAVVGVGEVVRVSRRPSGMGIAFRLLTPESRAFLSRLVTRRRRGAAAGAGRGGKP